MISNSPHQAINILLIEDDEVDILNIKRAFKKNNITNPLYIAGNGLEALDILRGTNGEPSTIPLNRRLILLDLNMPRMNGIEFLRVLRADPNLKFIPVVVLTTSEGEQDRVEAQRLNVAGYLLKPVQFSEFVELTAVLNEYWMLSKVL